MRGRGAISVLFWLLSWAALDDITTDNATTFEVEYAFLVLAGVWFAAVGVWLIAAGRRFTGVFSLVAVALAFVAFRSLPHHYGTMSVVNQLGFVPLLWFLGLAMWMLASHEQSAAPSAA
ncbi:MAG: hypothetical protein ACE148_06910 [Vicinamibacterales bacterium]